MTRPLGMCPEPTTEPPPRSPEPDAVLSEVLAQYADQLKHVARWPPGNRPFFMTRPSLTLLPLSVLPAGCVLFDMMQPDAWYVDPDHGPCLIVALNGTPCRSFAEMGEWTGWYRAGQAEQESRAREEAQRQDSYRSEEARKALARQRELDELDAARHKRDRLTSPQVVAMLEQRLNQLEQQIKGGNGNG